jgi:hypothetical protein
LASGWWLRTISRYSETPATQTAGTGAEPRQQAIQDIWESLKAFLLVLGDFACIELHSKDLQVWARLDPSPVMVEAGLTRGGFKLSFRWLFCCLPALAHGDDQEDFCGGDSATAASLVSTRKTNDS